MTLETFGRLTDQEVSQLDPYAFMAAIGKRVIHPGGRRSTGELFRLADFQPAHHVLEVGCGVGTTAMEIAGRYGCEVTAVDIDPLMLERARAAVTGRGLDGRIHVEKADIQALQYPDDTFDRVVIEAVTMFVDRPLAAGEAVRVCRSGEGRVLEHEFIYRKAPKPEVRRIFEGEVCPGIQFDTADDWVSLYKAAGLSDIEAVTGPFTMMMPWGMIRDEGIGNTLGIMGRTFRRRAYLRKMAWLMPRMARVTPSLGYVVLAGTKAADGNG
ncbi:MAG: class I SAM-dependent methyltransferase [Dehalococcoidia bacterium]